MATDMCVVHYTETKGLSLEQRQNVEMKTGSPSLIKVLPHHPHPLLSGTTSSPVLPIPFSVPLPAPVAMVSGAPVPTSASLPVSVVMETPVLVSPSIASTPRASARGMGGGGGGGRGSSVNSVWGREGLTLQWTEM